MAKRSGKPVSAEFAGMDCAGVVNWAELGRREAAQNAPAQIAIH